MIKFNLPIISDIQEKDLIKIILLLKHEKIHSKIFKLFRVKSRISINYKEDGKYRYHLYGRCTPLESPHISLVLFMDVFHFIYDVICDIFNLNIKKLKEDVKDFIIIKKYKKKEV